MIRKILVYENALANTHPALERAVQLAQYKNSPLKIVDIVNGPSNGLRELHRPMRDLVEQERKDRLDAICRPLHEQDIEFTTELIRGRPFVEIVREVVHEAFHLVLKTASSAEVTDGTGIMGPTDLRLVRNCPCPVWLEAPDRDVRWRRILVAIDPQAEDDDLNNALIEMGASLSKASGGALHIVSAWEVPDEEFLADKLRPEKVERYIEDVRSAAQTGLEALLVRAGRQAGPNNVHFRKGDPTRTILDCVETCDPDVVVIGTVGHTDVRGLLIGDTADMVLRQIRCSVLAVKPDSLFRV